MDRCTCECGCKQPIESWIDSGYCWGCLNYPLDESKKYHNID